MPKVLSYTPAWLSAPAPASQLFRAGPTKDSETNYETELKQGSFRRHLQRPLPRRVLAHRGSEVFVATGNSIRWADLAIIKDDWASKTLPSQYGVKREESVSDEEEDFANETKIRTLELKYVAEPILQLVPSPNNDFIAVVTAHTVHICIMPDSNHLGQLDMGPIRPKTHILGPTIHVVEQAPIVTVLWHPLGVDGKSLVTVTSDAVARIWELNMDNRSSLEAPTVALDLRKLRDARSAEDKVHPISLGVSKGFSLSAVGMDVASACFGGFGSVDEGGWSAMTLWIAMTSGDIYALCPFLPSKWQPPPTTIPSLTTSIATKYAGSREGSASVREKEIYATQYRWMTEIEKEQPMIVSSQFELSSSKPIHHRPKGTSFVPKLQGPFRIVPGDIDNDLDLADIHVVAPKLDAIDALDEEEGEFLEGTLDGLSTSLICLLTQEGRVYICLDLDGVEGQWLPGKKSSLKNLETEEEEPEIVILEAFDTIKDNQNPTKIGWPMFSKDVCSRHAFFVCHAQGIYYLSIDDWVDLLEKEFEDPSSSGARLRLDNLTTTSHTLREQMFTFKHDPTEGEDTQPSAPTIFQDSDLGYFLLGLYQNDAYAAVMDAPRDESTEDSDESLGSHESEDLMLATLPRVPYHPSERFSQAVALPAALDAHVSRRYRLGMNDEIRLSTATLDIMNEAHRVLSRKTLSLGSAVGALIVRCEEMQLEFKHQIGRVREIAGKVDKINDEDADDYETEGPRGTSRLDERLKGVQERHRELTLRHESLRKKVARAGGRPLSEKEHAWTKEVGKLVETLIAPEDKDGDEERSSQKEYWRRISEAHDLTEDLVARAKEETDQHATDAASSTSSGPSFKVPPDIRKNKIELIKDLLDRENALVEAASQRLERLNLSY